MKETNYWKQFMTTGSVEDYLHYRSFTGPLATDAEMTEPATSKEDRTGHAGLYRSIGNRITDGSDWRI